MIRFSTLELVSRFNILNIDVFGNVQVINECSGYRLLNLEFETRTNLAVPILKQLGPKIRREKEGFFFVN